jgi:hypothetical protein
MTATDSRWAQGSATGCVDAMLLQYLDHFHLSLMTISVMRYRDNVSDDFFTLSVVIIVECIELTFW